MPTLTVVTSRSTRRLHQKLPSAPTAPSFWDNSTSISTKTVLENNCATLLQPTTSIWLHRTPNALTTPRAYFISTPARKQQTLSSKNASKVCWSFVWVCLLSQSSWSQFTTCRKLRASTINCGTSKPQQLLTLLLRLLFQRTSGFSTTSRRQDTHCFLQVHAAPTTPTGDLRVRCFQLILSTL